MLRSPDVVRWRAVVVTATVIEGRLTRGSRRCVDQRLAVSTCPQQECERRTRVSERSECEERVCEEDGKCVVCDSSSVISVVLATQ